MLNIKNLKVTNEGKAILEGINLSIDPGKVYYLTGANGSGKSTLVNTITGIGDSNIEEGEIEFNNNNLIELDITGRSLSGIFLANQHPVEVPGVPLRQFLRLIHNVRLPEEEKLPVFKFRSLLQEKIALINYPEELLDRNLNEGMSGGEKKKTEILQMLILEPGLILLDEIDSGLDKKSIEEVFQGIKYYLSQNRKASAIVISHYDKAKTILKPDFEFEIAQKTLRQM